MRSTHEEIQTLLAMRRTHAPGSAYWRDFVGEFHHRQQQRTGAESGIRGLWSRCSRMMAEMGTAKWVYGAGLVYAGLTVAFLIMPTRIDGDPPRRVPVSHQLVPAPGKTVIPPSKPQNPAKPDPEQPQPANGEVF